MWVFHKAVPLQWQVDQTTGGAAANPNRRGKKEQTERGEKCRRMTVFVVNYSEIENDVPVDFLSLDCSLRHIETTPGQLFSFSLLFFPCLLFATLILHWHFCLTWKWSAVFWATYLTPPPSLPASVCSQFVSELTASCRPRAQQWPVWMFQALCCCSFFSYQFERSGSISVFLETKQNLL